MKTRPNSKDYPMENKSLLREEDGSIIIIVLIVLMLVTLMGISSTTTSVIEMQIAANEKKYKENFYNAEAEAMIALQNMDASDSEALKLDNAPSTLSWILPKDTVVNLADPTEVSTLTGGGGSLSNGIYYATNQGFTTGTSLGMTGTSQLYTFHVNGIVDKGTGGRAWIEVGYKRRF